MTASAGIVPGARILASAARNAYPQAVVKAIDQSDPSPSEPTPGDDLELHLPVAASAVYAFCCYLGYDGDDDTRPNGGLNYQWAVPVGAAMRFTSIGRTFGGGSQVSKTQKESTAYQLGSTGAGIAMAALMAGTLVTSTTSGTLQLQWATWELGGLRPVTIVHAQSFLALWQLSP